MSGNFYSRPTPADLGHGPAPHLLLQYVGFADTASRREYVLLARLVEQTRQYTVWIGLAAFARRKALRQDGPDICYQKLRRELASALAQSPSIEVTEADLTSYREAHKAKARF